MQRTANIFPKEGVQYAAGRIQLQPDKGRSFLSLSPGPYAGKAPARQGFPEASPDGPGPPGKIFAPFDALAGYSKKIEETDHSFDEPERDSPEPNICALPEGL